MAATLEVVAHWDGGYRCHLPVRQFEIVVDEPAGAGGTDSGPMPTELFLASLASCFTLSLYHAARKRSIVLPDLSVRVSGRYKGLRFEHITVEASSGVGRRHAPVALAGTDRRSATRPALPGPADPRT